MKDAGSTRTAMMTICSIVAIALSACQTTEQPYIAEAKDRFQLTNDDIEQFAETAYGNNEMLVRWEGDISYEIAGENMGQARDSITNVMKSVSELLGLGFVRAPYGTKPDFRVFFRRDIVSRSRDHGIKGGVTMGSGPCEMVMGLGDSGEIEEVSVYFWASFLADGTLSTNPQRDTLEDKRALLECFKYPFIAGFGGLGTDSSEFVIGDSMDEIVENVESQYIEMLLGLVIQYSPYLKPGMSQRDAVETLNRFPIILLPKDLDSLDLWVEPIVSNDHAAQSVAMND